MPLYMDIHKNVEGLTAEAAAEAHVKDLEVQGKYGVKYLHYWLNEEEGTVFCLCEAPNKEAAAAVHRMAGGRFSEALVLRSGAAVGHKLGQSSRGSHLLSTCQ